VTSSSSPEGVRTFRSPSGPVALILCGLLAVFLLGDAVIRVGVPQTLLLAPWVLLALWAVYELSFVSHIRMDDSGAIVQNMLRRTSFGWDRVRDIDLRWQLVFSLDDDSTVTCYGGPAHARPVRSRMRDGEETKVSAGLRQVTDIRDRWSAGTSTPGADAPIRRSWDGRALLALAVLVVWAAVSVAITAVG
jgi:hypothetical protein